MSMVVEVFGKKEQVWVGIISRRNFKDIMGEWDHDRDSLFLVENSWHEFYVTEGRPTHTLKKDNRGTYLVEKKTQAEKIVQLENENKELRQLLQDILRYGNQGEPLECGMYQQDAEAILFRRS